MKEQAICYFCNSEIIYICYYHDTSCVELIHSIGVCQSTVCKGKIPSRTISFIEKIKT